MFQMIDNLTSRLTRRPVLPGMSERAPSRSASTTTAEQLEQLEQLEAAFFAQKAC